MSGCHSVSYVAQAAWGQLDLLTRAQPIDDILRSDRASAQLKRVLREVERIKRFAVDHGLEASENYTRYAALEREAAVWVVRACPALSLEPKTWHFPIVGSVPYLGYFDIRDAEHHAGQLRAAGLDVVVRGAAAYSTLGWFSDPLLSTMFSSAQNVIGNLVDTVIHESVHATIYVPGQNVFNESLASFAAERLTKHYLSERFGRRSGILKQYRRFAHRRRRRIGQLVSVYERLVRLYDSDQPTEVKLQRKRRILRQAESKLGLEGRLNNAALAGLRTYNSDHAAFARLLERCGGAWQTFFQGMRDVEAGEFTEPQQQNIASIIDTWNCAAARRAPLEPTH